MRRTSLCTEGANAGQRKSNDRHSLLLGLALLLTLMCEVTPMGSGGALSTTITSSRDPTALQQLATFVSMSEFADEENLDWGAFSSLPQKQRGYKPPTTPSHTSSAGALSSTESEHGDASSTGSQTAETASSLSGLSGASRRRPHRRHRRGQKLTSDPSIEEADTGAGLSSMLASSSSSVHTRRFWSQLHVMEVAYSTHDNNFIQITERFAEYEHMYPIVYQCHLADVCSPAEADLLASPQQGLDASRFWTCEHCGKHHDAVREQCLRCRHPSVFTKLFVGQAVKEANCAQSLIRLFHGTHPHIAIHRIECHQRGNSAGGECAMASTERYKGCASVYVHRDQAQEMASFLNRNVFFDETADGEPIAHYVYTVQQKWLHALARARAGGPPAESAVPTLPSSSASSSAPSSCALNLARGPRAMHLPWSPLVVELSVSDGRPAKRGGERGGRVSVAAGHGYAPPALATPH